MSSTQHTGDVAIDPTAQTALMRLLRTGLTQGYIHFTTRRDNMVGALTVNAPVTSFASRSIIALVVETMGAECRYSDTLDAALALHEGMGERVMGGLSPRLIAPDSLPGLLCTDASNLSMLTGRIRGPRDAQFGIIHRRHAGRFGLAAPDAIQPAAIQPDPNAARTNAAKRIEDLAARMGGTVISHDIKTGPTE